MLIFLIFSGFISITSPSVYAIPSDTDTIFWSFSSGMTFNNNLADVGYLLSKITGASVKINELRTFSRKKVKYWETISSGDMPSLEIKWSEYRLGVGFKFVEISKIEKEFIRLLAYGNYIGSKFTFRDSRAFLLYYPYVNFSWDIPITFDDHTILFSPRLETIFNASYHSLDSIFGEIYTSIRGLSINGMISTLRATSGRGFSFSADFSYKYRDNFGIHLNLLNSPCLIYFPLAERVCYQIDVDTAYFHDIRKHTRITEEIGDFSTFIPSLLQVGGYFKWRGLWLEPRYFEIVNSPVSKIKLRSSKLALGYYFIRSTGFWLEGGLINGLPSGPIFGIFQRLGNLNFTIKGGLTSENKGLEILIKVIYKTETL